jgi:hypothetical protein
MTSEVIQQGAVVASDTPHLTALVRRNNTNARKGQCDGKTYAAYRGNGVNQHCAFYDNRFLYDLDSFNLYLSDTSPARGPYRMHQTIRLWRRNYA